MKSLIYVIGLLAGLCGALLMNNRYVFGSAGYLVPLVLIAIFVALLIRYRKLFGPEFQVAVWIVILLGLMLLHINRDEIFRHGNRLLAAFLPGKAIAVTTSDGLTEVLVHKTRGGHFEAAVKINGRELLMLVDTGASHIVLSARDAEFVGLQTDSLEYTVPVWTASGTSVNAPATLSAVSIGPISRRTVSALVSPPGELQQSLLGMSFLSTLGSFQMKADELRLTD